MGVIGGELAYRFLKWFSPGAITVQMNGQAYVGKSKLRVLLGDRLLAQVRDRDVIDFGSGHGIDAADIALAGARSVTGVDIQTKFFPEAEARAREAKVSDRVQFVSQPAAPADLIVSLDSFEHFGDPGAILEVMASVLRPGGRVVASFGPTWYHPLGGHLFSVFPWAHLVFTEAAFIRWRSDFKTDGATRFHEVAGGLNQMTIRRFEHLVTASPFRIVELEAVPIRRLQPLANAMTREFTTAIVRCVLELPPSTTT